MAPEIRELRGDDLPDHLADRVQSGHLAEWLVRLVGVGARVPEGFLLFPEDRPPSQWPEELREAFREQVERLLERGGVEILPSLPEQGPGAGSDEPKAPVFQELDPALEHLEQVLGSSGPGAAAWVVWLKLPLAYRGVCFTTDPTGRTEAMVVEHHPLDPLDDAGGVEAWRIYRSGTEEWDPWPLNDLPADRPLPRERLLELAELAAFFQSRVPEPMCLEWAVDRRGWIYWLGGRSLEVPHEPRDYDVDRAYEQVDDGPVTLWARLDFPTLTPQVLAPLSWSLWRSAILPGWVDLVADIPRGSPLRTYLSFWDRVQGRLYWNLNAVLLLPFVRPLVRRALARRGADVLSQVRVLVRARVIRPRQLPAGRARLAWPVIKAQIRNLFRFFGALFPSTILRTMRDFRADILERRQRTLAFLSGDELLREVRRTLDRERFPFARLMVVSFEAALFFRRALRAFRHHPRARRLLASGQAHSPFTVMALEIEDLARAAAPIGELFAAESDPVELRARLDRTPEAAPWIAALDRFLDRHGHRCLGELDLDHPRWQEDPSMVFLAVRSLVLRPPDRKLSFRLQEFRRQRRGAVAEAIAAAPAWRRPWLRWLAWTVMRYQPYRDMARDHVALAFQWIRLAALELGGRLIKQGIIEEPSDVFYLTWPELSALVQGDEARADFRPLVRRRKERTARLREHPAPEFLRSDRVPLLETDMPPAVPGLLEEREPTVPEGPVDLYGIASSPGRHQGRTVVLDQPPFEALEPGSVLVLKRSDPAWALLLPQAGALVVEKSTEGSVLGQVARELGIPAVLGVRDAVRRLSPGGAVQVDGSLGRVRLL